MRFSILLIIAASLTFPVIAQEKSRPYVVMISFDGFRHDYVARFNPPNFTAFIQQGAASEGLIPSYPSKTFPNHYTLVTGLYPGHHGLVDNHFYDPRSKKLYTMKDKAMVRDTSFYGGIPLWQLAQEQGLRAASYFWVGSETNIRGQYPTYYFPYNESIPNEKRVEQTLDWLKLPVNERPHFISLYFSLVDSEGHKTGPGSASLGNVVLKADSVLGLFMAGLKKIKLPVNVIIVSDHGMYELNREERTFIPLFTMMNIADPSIVFANNGTHMHIYTDNADSLYAVLKKQEDHFKVLYKKDLPASWHYDHPRTGNLMIIAEPGYYLLDKPRSFGAWSNASFGEHGYDPALVKDMQGIFYAMGPNIRRGSRIKAFENVHVYPLVAKILGLKTPVIDGDVKVLEPVYRK
jgi:predicted AlkP superfamily pyrophosphatase or phosphodiesterase